MKGFAALVIAPVRPALAATRRGLGAAPDTGRSGPQAATILAGWPE